MDRDEVALKVLPALVRDLENLAGCKGYTEADAVKDAVSRAFDYADAFIASPRDAFLAAARDEKPAAYVPKVGDVVDLIDRGNGTVAYASRVVVEVDAESGWHQSRLLGTSVGYIGWSPGNTRFVRPATAAERVAAGIDKPAAPPAPRFKVGDRVRVIAKERHRFIVDRGTIRELDAVWADVDLDPTHPGFALVGGSCAWRLDEIEPAPAVTLDEAMAVLRRIAATFDVPWSGEVDVERFASIKDARSLLARAGAS